MKQVSRYLLIVFFFVAGLNHFRDPEFYYGLIPDYLPYHQAINIISGLAEMAIALGLLFAQTRKFSAYACMLMLIAFIPSHWYFIQIGSCIEGGLCVESWLAWVRLVLIHPLLLFWVWMNRY